jgi:hypothetical protein
MPYIEEKERPPIDLHLEPIINMIADCQLSPGDLNYIITRIVIAEVAGNARYASYEAMLGRLEAVKLEWWRRVMVPYEDRKRDQNGDVF